MIDLITIGPKERTIEFYSARISLYCEETRACRMLFVLMKTLARNEEKMKMRNMRYTYGLIVRESVGIQMLIGCNNKKLYYLKIPLTKPNGLTDNTMR